MLWNNFKFINLNMVVKIINYIKIKISYLMINRSYKEKILQKFSS